MAGGSDPAARAGSRDERAGAVVPDGNFAGRPPGNLAGILSCGRFGKARESGARRKGFGITAGGATTNWLFSLWTCVDTTARTHTLTTTTRRVRTTRVQ